MEPPALESFVVRRPTPGERDAGLTLGPLELEVSGLDDAMAEGWSERFAPYATNGARQEGALYVRLGRENRDYFIPPSDAVANVQVHLRYEPDTERVRYVSHIVAGWFDTHGGSGDALLARGDYEPPVRALENYVRSCVAWQAASRGGALVHAASAVLDGRGYLFYGESGAGKSTLSECNRRARIVSDDLSLVLPGDDGRLRLVGSPFRGTYTAGDPVVGSFPLAAGFRIFKADAARVEEVPRLRALCEIVGNLPFVAEAFGGRPDLFAHIEAGFAAVPLAHLHFSKDESFWDAIAEWSDEH